jgi:hypothetical protein
VKQCNVSQREEKKTIFFYYTFLFVWCEKFGQKNKKANIKREKREEVPKTG